MRKKPVFFLILTFLLIFIELSFAQQLIEKKETIYLIDTSASMVTDNPKMGYRNIFPQVKAWILGYIEGIPLGKQEEITIMTFDEDVSDPFTVEIRTQEDKEKICNLVESLEAKGKYTYTTKAILKTLKFLESKVRQEPNIKHQVTVYLLTDGILEPPSTPYISWDDVKNKYKALRKIKKMDFVYILVPLAFRVVAPPGLEDEILAKTVIRLTPNILDFGEMTTNESVAKIMIEPLTPISETTISIKIIPDFSLPVFLSIEPTQCSISREPQKQKLKLIIKDRTKLEPGIYEGKIVFNGPKDIVFLPSFIKAKFSIISFTVEPTIANFGTLKKGENKSISFTIAANGLLSPKRISINSIENKYISLTISPSEIFLTPTKSQSNFTITAKTIQKLPWLKAYHMKFVIQPEGVSPIIVPVKAKGPFPLYIAVTTAVGFLSLILGNFVYKKLKEKREHIPRYGELIELPFSETQPSIRIGRKKKSQWGQNHISLWHESIALAHVEIRKEEDKFIVERLDGTLYINEERIEAGEIKEKDKIAIGDFEFEFVIKGEGPCLFVTRSPIMEE